MTERHDMEAAIEAVLFVSSEPVPRTRLLEMFDEDERAQAAEALEAVLARYAPPTEGEDGEGASPRGVFVEDVGGGVRIATRPEMAGWLRRFFDVSSGTKLSMAALETLAIIAYRQPITGPEVQELRSVNPAGVIKTLLERRLVRIAGRKEVVGKPFLYGTTREFLVHFGLNSLRDLPPLEEFEETFGQMASGDGDGGAPPIELSQATLDMMASEAAESPSEMTEMTEMTAADGGDREERILREAAEIADAAEAADAADSADAADTADTEAEGSEEMP
jgi:segregation and condensation protein B